MLRLLASISPIAVLLAGAIPAGAVGWFAHGLKFEVMDRPAIIREATATADAACAIRTMEAASAAEATERTRQRQANADALRIYQEAFDASQRAAVAAQSKFELEVQSYERQLAAEGRSCLLTDTDIDWLHQRGATSPD